MYWVLWADYIEYIGLTPHVVRQCDTIPSYSNIPRSHSGSAADGETGEEAEANIPCSHNSRCGAYDVAGEEADESSYKAVALCADVEVTKREGAVAVVEEAVLKMAKVNAIVVGLP